jgi:Tol biopolymer transport system component
MGKVYRATDTRLNRTVAIKVSAARFSERFEREARVIASLNHPNICTLYDVGPNYLVMEYVEGPTLAERIQRGPIPLAEALNIARQTAAALEEAHQRLIVHRDFKPGNVKIKPDGAVKVLDFGLAKLPAAQPGTITNATDSPTLTIAATQTGVLLGTASYMSPEQARGEPVDKRGDVWAFGVVLWEMLTGTRLFEGKTTSDVLAAVIRDEPDLSRVSAKVRPLLRRSLEKDPQKRLRDIGDAIGIIENTPEVVEVRRNWLPWGVGALAIAGLAALSLVHLRETPPEARLMTTSITAPENAGFTPGNPPALSPDGRRIVFSARGAEGKNQLWVRTLDSPAAQPLAGTEGAIDPFWSPDSRSIAFFADQKLKRMETNGGPLVTLAEAPIPYGGSWSPKGVIIFVDSTKLQRIAEGGGTATSAITSEPGHNSHYFPWFLPDGRHFLYTYRPRLTEGGMALRIGDLDSPEVKDVNTVGPISNINVAYSSGYVLFLRDSILMAQPFDEKRLVTTGDGVPLTDHVRSTPSVLPTVTMSSVAGEGLLAYQVGEPDSQQMTWFDLNGKPVGTLGDPRVFLGWLEFSPDRKYVAVTLRGQNDDIWIYDVARGVPARVTSSPAANRDPVWSPDGRSITYMSLNKGQLTLYRKAADGTGKEESLYSEQGLIIPSSWSPDGKFLLYFRSDRDTNSIDIWVLPVGPGGPSKPYKWSATPFRERSPKFSPDGHWVAYQADGTGRFEIFVAPFPGPGERRQISNGGGVYPRWRADGNEIFYEQNGTLAATEVSVKSGRIEVGSTRSLRIPVTGYGYDVTADGQRFLVVMPREQKSAEPLTLVQNWTALLKKK